MTGNATGLDDDFFGFAGLLPGGAFTVNFSTNGNGVLNFDVFDSPGTHRGSPGTQATTVSSEVFTGTVPGDGQLVAFVGHSEGSAYTVTLTAAQGTTTPEPASAALAGLGLATAGLLGARRRRK